MPARRRQSRRPPQRGPTPRREEIVETRIERLASDGAGVGRHPDGRILFVAASAPGDLLRVRITAARRRMTRGEIVEILEAAPGRTEPPCPVAGRCGGCSWQHLDYATQLTAKAEIVRDALERIGRIEAPEAVPIEPSPEPYGYRGRARLLVRGGRPGFRAAASNEHVAVEDCPVLAAPLRENLADLVATRPLDGEWELALGEPSAAWPTGVRRARLGADAAAAALELATGDDRVRIAAGGFAQANPLLFDTLIGAVLDAAGSGGTLLELYAGAGFLTLPLARRFARVVAVEAVATAVDGLRGALDDARLAHVEARCADAASFVDGSTLRSLNPDVVCVDPPRAGLEAPVAEALAACRAERLVYLSCDPATLARDLRTFTEAGWNLADVRAFDQFPQTPHVETLATLAR